MPMYKFEWEIFVTNEVMAELGQAAGVAAPANLKARVQRILTAVGGLPVTPKTITRAKRTQIALRFLDEALRHALSRLGYAAGRAGGYNTRDFSGDEYEDELVATPQVPINHATEAALAALPALSPAMAANIVKQRWNSGPFSSAADLDERVPGVGPARVASLGNAADYSVGLRERIAGSLGENLRVLMQRYEGSSEQRLAAALNAVAMCCAGDSHPFTRNLLPRLGDAADLPAAHDADWIGLLSGGEYMAELPDLLRKAASDIKVCMFHIALPEPTHPTHGLIDELVGAHQRGLRVRVLMDQDRPSDPYLSTIINAPAKKALEDKGVECRYDSTERLLHSKYLIIDDRTVVLGSHNWSAGSYFQFDDLSVAVNSPSLATALSARFQALWDG